MDTVLQIVLELAVVAVVMLMAFGVHHAIDTVRQARAVLRAVKNHETSIPLATGRATAPNPFAAITPTVPPDQAAQVSMILAVLAAQAAQQKPTAAPQQSNGNQAQPRPGQGRRHKQRT